MKTKVASGGRRRLGGGGPSDVNRGPRPMADTITPRRSELFMEVLLSRNTRSLLPARPESEPEQDRRSQRALLAFGKW